MNKLDYIAVVLASGLVDSSKLLAIAECLADGDQWVGPNTTSQGVPKWLEHTTQEVF